MPLTRSEACIAGIKSWWPSTCLPPTLCSPRLLHVPGSLGVATWRAGSSPGTWLRLSLSRESIAAVRTLLLFGYPATKLFLILWHLENCRSCDCATSYMLPLPLGFVIWVLGLHVYGLRMLRVNHVCLRTTCFRKPPKEAHMTIHVAFTFSRLPPSGFSCECTL